MRGLLQRGLLPSVQLEWFSQIITYANELINSCVAAAPPHLWWSTNMSFSWTLIILEPSKINPLRQTLHLLFKSVTSLMREENPHPTSSFFNTPLPRFLTQPRPNPNVTPELISPNSFYNCSSSTACTFYLSVQEASGDFIITECAIINKPKITFHSIHFLQQTWNFISFLSYFEGSALYDSQ